MLEIVLNLIRCLRQIPSIQDIVPEVDIGQQKLAFRRVELNQNTTRAEMTRSPKIRALLLYALVL